MARTPAAPNLPSRLRERIRSLARSVGVDRAIALSILGRAWSVIASPISLFLVGTRLTKQEQGYYYTFWSILGLSVFFDLALGYTVGVFASHERAHVTWTVGGSLTGEGSALSRMSSLLRNSARWYGAVSLLIITVIVPMGFVFFGREPTSSAEVVSWRWPWVWVGVVTALTCLFTPIWAFHDGIGCVAQTAHVRLVQQVAGGVALWVALWLGWRLYATPLVSTVAVLYGAWWLSKHRWILFRNLWGERSAAHTVGWWTEIWPLQWRIALSWLGAMYVFQTLAPILLFRFQGSVAAGQMGMSLTISQALAPVGGAWIATKTPAMGTLVARRDFKALDRLFFRALIQSTVLLAAGGVIIIATVWLLNALHYPFADRLLSVPAMGCLVGAALANHLAWAMAQYLRSHKREPLVWLSAAVGATTAVAVFLLARHGSGTAMALTYLVLTCGLNMAGSFRVFLRKRREWHE
jgi:hypothetical protein